MHILLTLYDRLVRSVERFDSALLGTLARFVFAAVLVPYFWISALTKFGDGIFGFISPSAGAYIQVFPRQMEAVGYDPSQLALWQTLVVIAGMWAEIVLPLMIVLGLFTRMAALAAIVFVVVQTLTDLYGHGLLADLMTVGAWFDKDPGSIIADQRLLWIVLLCVLVVKGAGPLSLDRLLLRRRADQMHSAEHTSELQPR